jgi:hypothetical protein
MMMSGEHMDKKMSDKELIAREFDKFGEMLDKEEHMTDDIKSAILDYWYDQVYEDVEIDD